MEQCVKIMQSRSSGWLKKLRQVSALTLVMLLAIVINVQASTYSETVRFDLKMKKVTLKEVFETITDQSEFKFVYNNDVVNDNQKVTVSSEDARVEEILDEILPKHDLEYRVIDRQVIVFPEKGNDAVEPAVKSDAQQQRTISGKVVDEEGLPLPGVSVVVKGTTIGIVTNIDGEYTLGGVPEDARALVFSFVGMQSQEIVLRGQNTINVTLLAETIDLDEVIAVGYASQTRANIVGSVTAVGGEEIASIPAADVTNAISGRLPGSIVIQESGEPGQNDAKILVRGRTTLGNATGPLIVIDGVPGRSLSEVDPVDIASISILKDASAA
ncbi:MAG: carboxypeptidase-like regulatory domain-containing protein, partial [Draconibacterium sp.]|nr:carboxypeptidase-like regulatory domain-containing protein [Draconibacterium sp.]